MAWHRSLIPTLVLAALLVPSPTPAQKLPPITALPNCIGEPQTRPKTVVFACADFGILAEHLTWSRWGEQFATAVGTLKTNTCDPNCAAGHYVYAPVIVLVAGRQLCPDGQIAYERAAYFRTAHGVPIFHDTDAWQRFECTPEPIIHLPTPPP